MANGNGNGNGNGKSRVGSTIDAMLKGIEAYASAKTVVGDPVTVGDTIILPLVDISIGVGAGAALNGDKSKNKDGGGLSAKVSPTAALIIHNGTTRLISLKDQTAVMKAMDMVPDLVNRFTGKSKITDPEVDEAIDSLKAEANKK
jgi:Uncharacterized conserved protein